MTTRVTAARAGSRRSGIRRGEAAREVDEIRVGRSAVAVPIHDAERCVVGALAAIGPTGRLSVDDADLVALLREYAERIVAPTMSKAS